MVVLGVILVILCWALPQVFPDAPPPLPALEHVGWVVGWILIVLGIVLWALGHFTSVRYGGRRHLY
jgi:hypothetical protein